MVALYMLTKIILPETAIYRAI